MELDKFEELKELENWNDEDLVEEFARVSQIVKQERDHLGYIQMLITQRMEESGATVMAGKLHNIEGTIRTEYDYSILANIRERLDPDDLEGMYTPAHDTVVHVEENWNMQQTKKLLKRGKPFTTYINDAKMTAGRMKIKVKEHKSI